MCQAVRRTSPEDDYLGTLTGLQNFLQQQSNIINKINNNNNNVNDNSSLAEHINMDSGGKLKTEKKAHKNQSSMSFTTQSSSCRDVVQSITKSSSSSMQTLRRIMEIEEMREFSEILELKLN